MDDRPVSRGKPAGPRKNAKEAIEWGERSRATFEEETNIIHFSRQENRVDNAPVQVRETHIYPSSVVKFLGVIMDAKLRYRQHIASTATKGLRAAMAFKRLKGLPPAT